MTNQGIAPETILMVTFTNRAAGEMRERIRAAFRGILHDPHYNNNNNNNQHELRLPMVKTFHSLAYSWIRTFWRQCGLGRYPNPLVTKSQQKKFLKQIIQAHLKQLQLQRCYDYLQLLLLLEDIQVVVPKTEDGKLSWEFVMSILKRKCPDIYDKAQTVALEVATTTNNSKTKKNATTTKTSSSPPKQQKQKTAKQMAAEQRKEAELQLLIQQEHQRQCYLELLLWRTKSRDAQETETTRTTVKCDLEQEWTGSTEQCHMYLKLIEQARLGQHEPAEYLPKDAAILLRYEKTQERTGRIDFDKMLELFVRLLQNNKWIANKFHDLYDYVIVDEYQDNSQVQSQLLREIVKDGRVTVVGDDDQCIYGFRGANPGNFEEFLKYYNRGKERVLEENYRSTGNILEAGAAFLNGANKRGKKDLRPTKQSGDVVELRQCPDPVRQAELIADSIKKSHDEDGLSWGDIACLFRCFQMGQQPPLHHILQEKLAEKKIPFKITGGHSFLESEKVMDVLAYLSLTLTGTPDRVDDEAFTRILNKPTRKIGKKLFEIIKNHQSVLDEKENQGGRHAPVGLEEAARALLSSKGNSLSDSQKKPLEGFFNLIDELRVAAIKNALPELLLHIWEKSGLEQYHSKKGKDKTTTLENIDDEEESGEQVDYSERVGGSSVVRSQIKALVTVAGSHVKEWKERDKKPHKGGVGSLFDLAKKCFIENVDKLHATGSMPPQLYLPQALLDDLYISDGIGLPVVSSFLADFALQTKEDARPGEEDDRVTISTIHRAKGLEWRQVYVPFFNEKYLPTNFREDKIKITSRHHSECRARETGNISQCSMNCASHNAEREAKRRGMTPEQLHDDEERRLAHVAATRAKDRLVFLSATNESMSSFERFLAELEPSIYESTLKI